MNKEEKKKASSIGRSIIEVVGAWMIIPIFGLATLAIVGPLAGVLMNDDEQTQGLRVLVLTGIFGVTLLALIVMKLRHFRRSLFSKNIIIGLTVGVALYALMIITGIVSTVTVGANSGQCSDLKTKISQITNATVPIATNLGWGTAFAIDNSGTLLTAYHVIDGASEVYANYATGRIPITVYKTAPDVDLALLKISQPLTDFISLTSNYSLGDPVYVYGYPGNTFNAGQGSLSSGIVSRVISNDDLKLSFPGKSIPNHLEFIQTDAAVNPGNSGGPVVGPCGIVGVADLKSDSKGLGEYLDIVSEQDINYAVSAKTAATEFGLSINGQ